MMLAGCSCGEGLDDVLAGGTEDGFKARSKPDLPIFAPPPCDLEAWNTHLAGRLDLQPEFLGLDDGLAYRVERSRAAGNGVVPLVAAYAWRTLKGAFF
jgi:DNA (cytosine-5)-methyltransferase 1